MYMMAGPVDPPGAPPIALHVARFDQAQLKLPDSRQPGAGTAGWQLVLGMISEKTQAASAASATHSCQACEGATLAPSQLGRWWPGVLSPW